jgi:hypothetical protein
MGKGEGALCKVVGGWRYGTNQSARLGYTYGPVLGQSGFTKTTNASRVLFKCIANQLHIDQMFILFLFLIIYCFLHVISNWGGWNIWDIFAGCWGSSSKFGPHLNIINDLQIVFIQRWLNLWRSSFHSRSGKSIIYGLGFKPPKEIPRSFHTCNLQFQPELQGIGTSRGF